MGMSTLPSPILSVWTIHTVDNFKFLNNLEDENCLFQLGWLTIHSWLSQSLPVDLRGPITPLSLENRKIRSGPHSGSILCAWCKIFIIHRKMSVEAVNILWCHLKEINMHVMKLCNRRFSLLLQDMDERSQFIYHDLFQCKYFDRSSQREKNNQ